ncbi:MAG: two-component system response regulator [Deltaproteobacteria bacterium]|nr:MAG: two-component system response regulator [Deltaproteobacteria bacterium]
MPNEKVLLVDDEKDFLSALAERMEVRGMEVATATTGQQALEMARANSYDAIVLDLQLPDIDGLETLKGIKASHPEAQIILLTGHATVEKGIEAMKIGATDFLEKPADFKALTAKITAAKEKKMVIVQKQHEEKISEILESKGW